MNRNYAIEYDILLSKVHRWGEIIRYNGALVIQDIEDDILNCLELIKVNRDVIISRVFKKKDYSDHSAIEVETVNICLLSLAIGIDLELTNNQLIELGISALLKDLGMNKVPKEILEKEGNLSKEELAEIKNHPQYSVDIIKNLGFGDNICNIVIDHHERWDGKGYPRGKTKENINYLSRILAVLDGYNSMMEERPYRQSIHGYDAIKEIIGDNGKRYDSGILSVVVRSIGIYPIGSYVALNDASICEVISVNKAKPLKPVVKVIVNKDGTESKNNNIIDISDNNRFFIVKSVLVS